MKDNNSLASKLNVVSGSGGARLLKKITTYGIGNFCFDKI